MVGKMILSPLPGGGYVQLRQGYSNLDLLAAVCGAVLDQMEKNPNSNSSSSSSSPKSVFIPRRKRSRPSKSRSGVITAASALKCVVSGFKTLSIGGGPGNQKKRAAKKIKKRVVADDNQQPAAEAGPMPGRFRDRIRQIAGPGAEIAEEMLLIEKEITATDLNPNEGRLALPLNQLRRTDFMTAEEEQRLATRRNNGKNVGSLDVALIAAVDGEIVKREVDFRRWEMRTSSMLMVTGKWNKIKGSLGLAVGTKVQIWSVRVDGKLWLSLVVL
ncbi:unnamed protein product [Cuscuta epithymum]|uniref:TF-B3 domain-containing protein n=1 Tax=Cuscuta epithymum TaxID=186058 RepID=A0AAV0E9D8_9ASTE|nr:unnamed protein product [Cuscuta epithymum]